MNKGSCEVLLTEVVDDLGEGSRCLESEEKCLGQYQDRPGSAVREGTVFHGRLSLEEAACIDGKLLGEICATSAVFIGEQAVVEATVICEELIIYGMLSGDVTARKRVVLMQGASLIGNVYTPELEVREGGLIQGTSRLLRI